MADIAGERALENSAKFHREDIAADTDRNYSFLEKVFEGFGDLRKEGAMESLNMQEFFHRFERVKEIERAR